MLNKYNPSQTMKEKLNQLGKDNIPFVFLIDFECKKPRYWTMQDCSEEFLFNFQNVSNIKVSNTEKDGELRISKLEKHPKDIHQYTLQFDAVKKEIEYGNSFLINLTTQTPIEIDLSIEEIFHKVQAKYTCLLKNAFVCFSPETFVHIKEGKIYSYPMKGTINAALPNAKEILLNNEKEIAEHATIVDLIRNDLSKVSHHVTVSKYRFYEEIKTQTGLLGQVSSEIVGELPVDFKNHIGDILFDLLPAGSVSGAPKDKTVEIIAHIEQQERGYYTGVAGYFDGENLDSCVLIRYIQNNMVYRSGGGITFLSELEQEYQEMIDKVYVPIF
jgi:para-aminobenzoate synthetase component 1